MSSKTVHVSSEDNNVYVFGRVCTVRFRGVRVCEMSHSTMTQRYSFTGEGNVCNTAAVHAFNTTTHAGQGPIDQLWLSSCSTRIRSRDEIAITDWRKVITVITRKSTVRVLYVCLSLQCPQTPLSSQVDPFKTQWRITFSSGHWLHSA